MKENIPSTTLCANGTCPKARECMLHTKYAEAQNKSLVLQLLNTSLLDVTSEGCEYIHIARKVTVARGFRMMYNSTPRMAARNLWKRFPQCDSRRQFYRLLSGDVALFPEYQEVIISFFKSLGADTSLGFDAYEEVTV